MELLFVLGVIYLGGPIGVLLVILGAVGVARNKTPGEYGWPGLFLVIGVILLIAAVWLFFALANTNFGL